MFLNRANEILSPGYLPFETGYRRLDAVQIEIACLHRLHGSNGKMLEWWTRRIGMDDWLARQHPGARLVEWVEKPVGNEYIGAKYIVQVGHRKWLVSYHSAAEMVDTSLFESNHITFATSARIGSKEAPYWAGKFLQVCRDTDFGCEVRNRYWFGDTGLKDKSPNADSIAQVTDQKFAAGMIAYDLEGMENLESFLPDVYAKR
ncbi:MAG: DAPG hydrolase family protein [Gammaproteobacteria bacterium]